MGFRDTESRNTACPENKLISLFYNLLVRELRFASCSLYLVVNLIFAWPWIIGISNIDNQLYATITVY